MDNLCLGCKGLFGTLDGFSNHHRHQPSCRVRHYQEMGRLRRQLQGAFQVEAPHEEGNQEVGQEREMVEGVEHREQGEVIEDGEEEMREEGEVAEDEEMREEEEVGGDEEIREEGEVDDDTALWSMIYKWKARGKGGDRELGELFTFLFSGKVNLDEMKIRSLGALKKFHRQKVKERGVENWTTAEFESPIPGAGLITFHYKDGVQAVRQLFAEPKLEGLLELQYKRLPEDPSLPRIRSSPANSDWWKDAQVSISYLTAFAYLKWH